MRVALVNTNRIRPPVAPIGIDYVAESLAAAGHEVFVLDLCFEEDVEGAAGRFFAGPEFGLVGLSVRNTDDCSFASRDSFLPGYSSLVADLRKRSGALLVLGGVGFSVMPEVVLGSLGVDAGIRGDGEFFLPLLASRIEGGDRWDDLPNLVLREGTGWRRTPSALPPLDRLPPMTRSWIDNRRYFREGGQGGIETKRGCPMGCVYCADPVAKGAASRPRHPASVADEVERLLSMGIDHLHTCDSEFNVPREHAEAVCREIIRRGVGDKVRWYAYCAPLPFPSSLAALMRRAGCAGINFGVDSGDPVVLARLGRTHRPPDILAAARRCRENGIAVMLDLLVGGPGETAASIARTIDLVREADPDRAGVAVGVRVYPGTPLWESRIRGELSGGLVGGETAESPLFFLDPAVSGTVFDLLDRLVGGDDRFLFFDPTRPERNYNYNANDLLARAIADGHRGAYWDILRRLA